MRESIKFLKDNEKGWQQRRIGEVDRIKEEEKMERLAIGEQKRKRYGIKKLNKEEQKRIKERTSEIIEICNKSTWRIPHSTVDVGRAKSRDTFVLRRGRGSRRQSQFRGPLHLGRLENPGP